MGNSQLPYQSPRNFQCNSASSTTHKSWGDGRVATVAGIRWCWEPLVTDLHLGGQDWIQSSSCSLRQGQSSAAVPATEQPSLGTALLPPSGEGPRKGGLKKACLTTPCQPTAAGWASNNAVEKQRKHPWIQNPQGLLMSEHGMSGLCWTELQTPAQNAAQPLLHAS